MTPPLRSALALAIPLLIAANLAAQPVGKPLLPATPDTLVYFGPSDAPSILKVVPVEGQPFKEALEVNLGVQHGERGLIARIPEGVKKGDVVWISFWSRNVTSTRESGEASFTLRLDRLVNGKYKWPPYLELAVSVGKEWTETSVPVTMEQDAGPADYRILLDFDYYAQRFEISPITVLNYGPSVAMESLPRTLVRYDGGDPDAPWRQAALDRIEKIRKGTLALRVVDADGRPVPDATVEVRMKRNAFNWGTEIQSRYILDDDANSKKYREVLEKYFNQAVYGNEMKWGRWREVPDAEKGVRMKKANAWLRERGFGVRGHVMVWPSFQHMPKFMRENEGKPEVLRQAVLDHIAEQTRIMKGEFVEWDVINEPFAHNDLMRILGRDVMTSWFQAARAGEPDAELFLNDYTMFHGEGPDSPSEKFYDNVKFLLDQGAPIDAIGEQAHIGGTPPGIPKVLERLDHFAKLGLPIQITEFDVNSNDEDFKARYTRDFMTAIYSHPSTTGFVQWGFWAPAHWFPVAAMWNPDWTMRPNGEVYAELVTKTWWTNADGRTNADGAFETRGFLGDYEVTVARGDKSKTTRVKLTADSPATTITLP